MAGGAVDEVHSEYSSPGYVALSADYPDGSLSNPRVIADAYFAGSKFAAITNEFSLTCY
jgi:hypothetical protein